MKKKLREIVEVDGVAIALEFSNEQNVAADELRFTISYLEKSKNIFSLIINEKIYDGVLHQLSDETYSVMISQKNYQTKIIKETENTYRKYKKDTDEKKNVVMYAPMPGLITKIFVRVGDRITIGTRICILEAMKMENDIHAMESGEVAQIYINEKSIIEKGEKIIAIG